MNKRLAKWLFVLFAAGMLGLAGCKGDTGSRGATGPAGPAGPPGSATVTATANEACGLCHGDSNALVDVTTTSGTHATTAETGLFPTITGVTIGAGGDVTVAFSINSGTSASHTTAAAGVAPGDINFTLAYLDMNGDGASGEYPGNDTRLNNDNWVPFFTTQKTYKYDATKTVTQATTQPAATGSNFVDNGDGTYTWVLQAAADGSGGAFDILTSAGYNATTPAQSMIYRVGIEIRAPHGSTDPEGLANATFDFQPTGAGTPADVSGQYRELVVTSACSVCHDADGNGDALGMHGGPRRNVKYCDTCHNPTTSDAGGVPLDLRWLVHRVHMGKELPSVQAGELFRIVGYNGSYDDFSKVGFPQNITNCQKCHVTDNTSPDYANDALDYANAPSIEACGSCHDDIYWTASPPNSASYWTQHSGGVKTDAQCASCHNTTATDLENPQYAHRWAADASYASHYAFKIDSATYSSGSVTVTFEVDKDGTAMDLSTGDWAHGSASRLGVDIGWKATGKADYTNDGADQTSPGSPLSINVVNSGALESGVTNNNDGTYSVTQALPATGQAAAQGIAILEGHPGVSADTVLGGGTLLASTYDNIPATSTYKEFAIKASSVTARRQVVDASKCEKCHNTLSLHGENRTVTPFVTAGNSAFANDPTLDVTVCTTCHNSSNTDIANRPASGAVDGKTEESIDFKRMIHRIHIGTDSAMNTTGVTIYGYHGSVNVFAGELPPGTPINDCEICHLTPSGTDQPTYIPPLPDGIEGSTVASNNLTSHADDLKISPYTSVCSSCHQMSDGTGHMQQMGGNFSVLEQNIQY